MANEIVARPVIQRPRGLDRQALAVEAARSGNFASEFWAVVDKEDDSLVADEVLNGAMSGAFVYSMKISGQEVTGVSVVGAKHLARHYGGLKHRIVASVQKQGALHRFTSYPAENVPMSVSTATLHELEEEPDYYSVVVEMTDIRNGNTVQVERQEMRFERRRDGTEYERPNYQTIAQSKAMRNAILSLIPQDVKIKFEQEALKLGKSRDVSDGVLDHKRTEMLRWAEKVKVEVRRDIAMRLGMVEIDVLAEAAAKGGVPAFVQRGLEYGLIDQPGETASPPPPPAVQQQTQGPPAVEDKRQEQVQVATVTAPVQQAQVQQAPVQGSPPPVQRRRQAPPAQQQQPAPPAADDAEWGA